MGFSSIKYRGAGLLHTLYAHSGRLGRKLIGNGSSASAVLGKIKVGPWVYCRLENTVGAQSPEASRKYESVADLLRCPLCDGDVEKKDNSFQCVSCEASFPIREGIIDFRVPQALNTKDGDAGESAPAA